MGTGPEVVCPDSQSDRGPNFLARVIGLSRDCNQIVNSVSSSEKVPANTA